MTLDKEQHRAFLLNALASVQVQGTVEQMRAFVAMADEVSAAIKAAPVMPPLAGDDLHG